jgi:hypothetical protein
MANPTPENLTRSDLLFTLVRSLVDDRPVAPPPSRERAGQKTAAPATKAGK